MESKEQRMTSIAGNRIDAFTLIEVLVAAAILSLSMVGVIRGYIMLVNGVESAHFAMEGSYLLKEKMADIEEEAIETGGVSPETRNGVFSGDYTAFKWETDIKETKKTNPTVSKKEYSLSEVAISVITDTGFGATRKMDLYTYMRSRP